MPELPCVNVGTPTKPCWLPIEFLWVAPGQRRLKLNEKQVCIWRTYMAVRCSLPLTPKQEGTQQLRPFQLYVLKAALL